MHPEAQESVYIHRGKNQAARLVRPDTHILLQLFLRGFLAFRHKKQNNAVKPLGFACVPSSRTKSTLEKSVRRKVRACLRSGYEECGGRGKGACLQKKWSRNPSEELLRATTGWQRSLQTSWEIVLSSVQDLSLH